MKWRRYAVTGAVVLATVATLGAAQYLTALSRDPDKEAALRRAQSGGAAAKMTATLQGSSIPTELAVGEKQQPFTGGQKYMAIMNSELTDNYTEKGWRGAGRSMSPGMGMPSFTVPAGGFDSPLWASGQGITAYLPIAAAAAPGAFAEGSFVGTNNVYRNPPHTPISGPFGYWSDQGGVGSAGFAGATTGPGGYREPFITETEYYNNVGIDIKRQSYSFSFGYNHTNDFILLRHVLNTTGDVDVDRDGTLEETGVTVKNFFMVFNYDFDIPTGLDPNSNNINENRGGDDKTPTGMFLEFMPRSVPADLRNSGRTAAPYGPRTYSGIATMFDEDDPGGAGVDDYIWSNIRQNFNPLHMGEASLMVLEGDGTGAKGDLDAAAALDMYDAPSVGLFQVHSWWESDWKGVYNWYAMSASKYLKSYPGDPAVGTAPAQPLDFSPNPDMFTGGALLEQNTDISTWTAKTSPGQANAGLGLLWGDPRNLTQAGNPGIAAGIGLEKGRFDNISLFQLDGVMSAVVPDPYTGGDRKEITSTTGCDRNMIGWGPYTKAPGEDLTIWEVDMVGAGKDGIYDVYLRALDVWMQRKYNAANDTYYWDGSNDRIIPTYNANGSVTGATETINLGRGADSGTLFHPPPPPTLSVFPTNNGTIAIAWENNAESAIDPGTGTADMLSYRLYRASGFIDQMPLSDIAHPVGYNSTIIPPNMGLSGGDASPIIDVTSPTAAAVELSHPYARFIQEGLVIGADYNIGGVFAFVTGDVNRFAAPGFAGPYVQIAGFGKVGDQTNTFAPPALVTYKNPLDSADRVAPYTDDTIETEPSSTQIGTANTTVGATTAWAIATFPTRYAAAIGTGTAGITSVGDILVDSRLVGKSGYIFEDRTPLIGFSYWYYLASVDGESATQKDFDSVLQDPTGSTKTVNNRTIVGLESFYTMNANGTDGRWHGTFPFRGRTVGPQVPGQEVIPTTKVRNSVTGGTAEFMSLITVAPNPFVFQAQWDLASQSQSVKFFNMPVPSRVTIFDSAGLLVRQFNVPDASETQTVGGVTSWDLKNVSNVPVSGGLYICVVEAEIGGVNFAKTLKLYVRR